MKRMAQAFGLALFIALIQSTAYPLHAQQISAPVIDVLQGWMEAVQTHTPGADDAAAGFVRALTLEQRTRMAAGLPLVLNVLAGRRVDLKTPLDQRLAELAGRARDTVGEQAFLMRAVTVHGDAAMLGYREPDVRAVPEGMVPGRSDERAGVHPLLAERVMWIEADGRFVGMTVADWQWGFARNLMARVRTPATQPFVASWYHATTAFLFQHRNFSEIRWHLAAAAALLPDDAAVLLDRGCAAEQAGLPRSQSVNPNVTANGDAESFFRRSIARDPRQFEARLRLARLLSLKKRYAEALEVIAAAPTESKPDESAEYLAHLIAARAEQGLGRLDGAAARAQQARALIPEARSAMMAASHIALLRADVNGAMDVMHALAALPPEPPIDADPWWIYETCTGRYADTLLQAMWRMAPR